MQNIVMVATRHRTPDLDIDSDRQAGTGGVVVREI